MTDPVLLRARAAGIWTTSPTLFAGAFGCPVSIATMALNAPTTLLRAIITLGPGRVRWAKLSDRPCRPQGGVAPMPCWLLDGAATDHDAICAAAGINGPDAR